MKYSYGKNMSGINTQNQSQLSTQSSYIQAAKRLLKDSSLQAHEQSAGTSLTTAAKRAVHLNRPKQELNTAPSKCLPPKKPYLTWQKLKKDTPSV